MEERYGPAWRETTDVVDVRRLAAELRGPAELDLDAAELDRLARFVLDELG